MCKNPGLPMIYILLCICTIGYGRQQTIYNVKEFGAQGLGLTIESPFIQQAINACYQAGGGQVYFPAGTYLSGSLELKSNVILYLDAGAILKGSPNLEDYIETSYVSESRSTSLIYAHGVKNTGIMGRGTIDGNDDAFFDWNNVHPGCCFDPAYTRQGKSYSNRFPDGPAAVKGVNPDTDRPGALVTFIKCKNINVSGIHVEGSPNWCLHFACCDGVYIDRIDVRNSLLVPNADCIDASKCKNVFISNSYLEAGDDGIAIGTCADGYCEQDAENIVVSNCTIISRSAGIRLGWSTDDIKNCVFQNLIIHSNRGIGIFTRHDETIENIHFDNVIVHTRLHTGWWGNGEPVHISEIPLGELHGITSEGKKHGEINNIRFTNLSITGESGILLFGYHPNSIRNIVFEGVSFQLKNSDLNSDFGGNFDLRPAFTDSLALFKHNIPAMFVKHVDGLRIMGFSYQQDNDLPGFYKPEIQLTDSKRIQTENLNGTSVNGSFLPY